MRKFIPAVFDEITEKLSNPDRGWYQIFTFYLEQEPDLCSASGSLNDDESVVLLLICIEAFREKPLDKTALEHLDEILSFFAGLGRDILLRICYDCEGKGLENEPSFFSTVLNHLKQIIEIVQKYQNSIFIFQGMTVGSWGEMHSSKFLRPECMRKMQNVLKAGGVFTAVRRPVQWRILYPEHFRGDGGTGLYNDGIFGSFDDLGTYGEVSHERKDWESPWGTQNELEFEEHLCRTVPQVGEAVYEDDHEYKSSLMQDADRLRKMHLSCLNCRYDLKILNVWRSWRWSGPGVWNGMNGYDYIGRHLGYRFCIRKAKVRRGTKHSQILTVWIENIGFASYYKEGEIWLICTDSKGGEQYVRTDWDMRQWESNRIFICRQQIPPETDKVYLEAYRTWDHRKIHFANPSSDGRIFLGQFC